MCLLLRSVCENVLRPAEIVRAFGEGFGQLEPARGLLRRPGHDPSLGGREDPLLREEPDVLEVVIREEGQNLGEVPEDRPREGVARPGTALFDRGAMRSAVVRMNEAKKSPPGFRRFRAAVIARSRSRGSVR